MVYLDNAATSFPKPQETVDSLNDFVRNLGGNPGRSGHTLSVEAARIIFEARESLTKLINGRDSGRMIFTQNGTESLNLAILGLLDQNDHVITTSMEHNSVMRPLTYLQSSRGVDVSVVQCSPEGELDGGDIKALVKRKTRAVIINQGSNVTGTVQDIGKIRSTIGDALLIVDACQTIGSVPIDVERDSIDILCFSCHKSLYAIQGLGGLYIRKGVDPRPLKFGGTGSRSESIEHPSFMPDKYECGTPNTPGIASLLGGLAFIERVGQETIEGRDGALKKDLLAGLEGIGNVTIYGNRERNRGGLPVIAFNIKGKLPSEVGYELNRREIYVRVGLQCSPVAHKTIGTFPEGTVRVSPGYFTTDGDVAVFLEAVKEIAES
jgi:cysteine desulfurase family protein